jgi:hypothetical protein
MYKVKTQILQTPVTGGNILLLEPEQGQYFELNEVSVLIFQGIQSQHNESEIINNIVANYNISKDDAEKDVTELIQLLQKNNIIECV